MRRSDRSRQRTAVLLMALVVVGWQATGIWSATASDCVLGLCLGPTTTTTATTMPPGTGPPSSAPPAATPGGSAGPPGTTTPAPEDPNAGAPAEEPATDAAPELPDGPPPGEGDDTATPSEGAGPFPAELQRKTDSVRRSAPSDTKALIDALAPLGQYGVGPSEAALVGFGRFPVAGPASYVHDWWFPRFGPAWRLHQGTDIFAGPGTPVRAPADGRVRLRDGGLGGIVVYVVEPDGTYYYMAHLMGRAEGLSEGDPVTVGQVVGYVGSSGNAGGGASHLHIEIHPGGGPAVDPKGFLDRFLADALTAAPALIESYAERSASGAPAGPQTEPPAAQHAAPPRSAYLWAASMNPAGGAFRLAQIEAARAAARLHPAR